MRGAIPPLPQYAFMAWYSVESTGITLLYFTLLPISTTTANPQSLSLAGYAFNIRYLVVYSQYVYHRYHVIKGKGKGTGRFTTRERAPGTYWIGGWVGTRAVLDAVVKRKIPSPRRESNPRTPTVQPVAQRYTD
jgi:hypothetical protein